MTGKSNKVFAIPITSETYEKLQLSTKSFLNEVKKININPSKVQKDNIFTDTIDNSNIEPDNVFVKKIKIGNNNNNTSDKYDIPVSKRKKISYDHDNNNNDNYNNDNYNNDHHNNNNDNNNNIDNDDKMYYNKKIMRLKFIIDKLKKELSDEESKTYYLQLDYNNMKLELDELKNKYKYLQLENNSNVNIFYKINKRNDKLLEYLYYMKFIIFIFLIFQMIQLLSWVW
jgi:hypothetical protein